MTATQTNETSLATLPPKPASAAVAPAVPQYAQGFEGAATAPFPAEATAVLGEPVKPEEVETKPNGIVYLPGVWYRRQLTRAFGAGAWALLPRGPARTMGEIVIYHGALYILGRFVSEAVGECETRYGMSYASSLEGARTDALTRCCKDLGMATELWDPEWRGAWQAKYCKKEWKEGKDGKKGSYVFTKLDKPNGGPAPVAGRNVGPTTAALNDTTAKLAAEMKGATAGAPAPIHDLEDASRSPAAAPPTEASNHPLPTPVEPSQTPSRQGVNPGAGGQAAFPKDDGRAPAVDVSLSADTATGAGGATADTGEAASAAEIELLRTQVAKLKWGKPKARSWLNAVFGETKTEALTKQQAADAFALLLAAGQGDDDSAYAAVYERLKGEGRVL